MFFFHFLLYGRVALRVSFWFYSILFYSILYFSSCFTLSLFSLYSLLLFWWLPVKQSESTLIPLPALSYTDSSGRVWLGLPVCSPGHCHLLIAFSWREVGWRERAQDRKGEGERRGGGGWKESCDPDSESHEQRSVYKLSRREVIGTITWRQGCWKRRQETHRNLITLSGKCILSFVSL